MLLLYNGFTKFFENLIKANAAYVEGTFNIVPFYQEMTILHWRFLLVNKNVYDYFTRQNGF